jgi:hypothetical protein
MGGTMSSSFLPVQGCLCALAALASVPGGRTSIMIVCATETGAQRRDAVNLPVEHHQAGPRAERRCGQAQCRVRQVVKAALAHLALLNEDPMHGETGSKYPVLHSK